MAQCIQLFTSLQEVDPKLATRILGFQSMASLVATVIVVNLGLAVVFVALTAYHIIFRKSMQVLRLVSSREVPHLELNIGMHYHLFLSHIWSSGQDQAANIKRMLQLLLPGVKVFLGAHGSGICALSRIFARSSLVSTTSSLSPLCGRR